MNIREKIKRKKKPTTRDEDKNKRRMNNRWKKHFQFGTCDVSEKSWNSRMFRHSLTATSTNYQTF